jgi:hypothetical protein
MNKRALSAVGTALGLAVLLAGCGPISVEPFILESEAMFDPRLLGTWIVQKDEDQDEAYLVPFEILRAEGHENAYYITDGTDGGLARLGRLGEHLVLEFIEPDGVLRDLEIPGHWLAVLEIGDDQLRIRLPDKGLLEEALEAGEVRLAHRRSPEGHLVLFDSSIRVREQLAAYLARPGALGEWAVLRRVKDASLAGGGDGTEAPCFEPSPWPEADRMFRRDPAWDGGRLASAIDLGAGRTLWLFSPARLKLTGQDRPVEVGNALALQVGAEPTSAELMFYWGIAPDGAPTAFFAAQGDESFRFGNGVRVNDRLVLFLSRRRMTEHRIEHVGWSAIIVENPDAEPSDWQLRPVPTLASALDELKGIATLLRLGGHVYVFGWAGHPGSPQIYAARWADEAVHAGDLSQPEWWSGTTPGWVLGSSDEASWLFNSGRTELSIHFDPGSRRYVAVQLLGQGSSDLALRAAPQLVGSWSDPQMIYRPSESYRPGVSVFSARAHPELAGADLVLSYDTSSGIRFVKLSRCAWGDSP